MEEKLQFHEFWESPRNEGESLQYQEEFFSFLESSPSINDNEVWKFFMNIGTHYPHMRPTLQTIYDTRTTELENMLWISSEMPEISAIPSLPENPEITQKLQHSQRAVENIFANLQYIQNTFHNSTNLTTAFIDGMKSLFSDDTVFQSYKNQFEFAQSSGQNILNSLQTIDVSILNSSQKQEYDSILQTLQFLSTLKLEHTGFLQMLKNEIYAIPHTVDLMAYAVKGIVTGVYEWVKNIITSAADLAIFLGKYSFSSDYRTQINEQAENIRNIIETHGLAHISDQIFQELDQEMTRISGLPDLEKSEAIGNLTGHILSFVGVAGGAVKIASRIEKLGTLSTLGTLWKAEKVSLYTFDVLLNGVAETAIMKSISVSYKWVKAMLGNTELAHTEKIRILDTELVNIQQLKSEIPEEIHILGRYKEELIYQKQIFENLQRAKEVQVPYLEQLRNIDDELQSLKNPTHSQNAEIQWRIQQLENEKIRVNIERQVMWLEKLWVPEEFSRDLLGSGLLIEKIPGKDLLWRFEKFLENGVDYNRLIEQAMEKIPWLTKEDGLYVFMYTDLILYQKCNGFMRQVPSVIETMTPEQVQIATRFTQRLEEAFEKMPNMRNTVEWWEESWKLVIVYRGDAWWGWIQSVWEVIELKAFTSVANNTDDALIFPGSNIFITIEWLQWKVKDITSLALVPNYWKNININPTTNEWVILPNTKVEILNIGTWARINTKRKIIDTIEIKVQQIQ